MIPRQSRPQSQSIFPACLALVLGCGGGRTTVASPDAPDQPKLPIDIEHESCDEGSTGAAKVDVNGDGRPDIVRVLSGGREACRIIDLNFDGKIDSYRYFDEKGALRRIEADWDRDGKIDEIAHFAGGKVTRKDREMNLDGKFDTWDFYEREKLVRRFRDATGDGKVDEWWTWPNPDKSECPTVVSDRDGDGRPDLGSQVDHCEEPGAPPPAPPPAAADGGSVVPANATEADAGAGAAEGDAGGATP